MSQSGFTQVSGTRVLDATGSLLLSGVIAFTPVLDNCAITSFQAGGTLHGQVLGTSVFAGVTNGAFTVPLADTSLTNPVNISYQVTVTDNISGAKVLQGSGYRIQPTGAAWNFDTFIPALTPQLGYIISKGDKGDTGSPGSFGPTVKTATQLGCVSDGVTDCAPILNSFFANASASNPRVLYLDTPGLIPVNGIFLSPNGYCSIIGMGDSTGFLLLNGANVDVIAMGYTGPDTGSNPPPIAAQNVTLQNFRIDGNRAGQQGNISGIIWRMGINFTGVRNVRVENVTVEHASTYSMRFGNVQNVNITNCRLFPFLANESVYANNTDGIHINGTSSDIVIEGCQFRTGDDSIALNSPEGYGGLITRVTISNCTFNGSQTGIRILGNSADNSGIVSMVSISNLSGSVNIVGFIFGVEAPRTLKYLNTITNIAIANAQLIAPTWALIADSISGVQFSNCSWVEPKAAGFLTAWVNTSVWTGVNLSNCRILRDTAGNTVTGIVDTVSSLPSGKSVQINHLSINGFAVDDEGYTSAAYYGQLPVIFSASNFFTPQMETSGLTNYFNNLLSIAGTSTTTTAQYNAAFSAGSVTSEDLVHMEPVPDSIVSGGSMYYSSDASGALSINNAGTPKRL